MSRADHLGKAVLSGTWFYGGSEPRRISIVAYDYDRAHAAHLDDAAFGDDSDYGAPTSMGPDGLLYYVSGTRSPGLPTVDAAKAWADSQPWGPVRWDSASKSEAESRDPGGAGEPD